MNKTFAEKIIYFIAFAEGAAVMGIELAGVKIISPFFGTTLYVWAAVLSVTLGGLALGYFLGGGVASRFSGLKSTPLVLLIGALLIALMPFTALTIMPATANLGIRLGALLSATLFLMPPLICLGMISPILIQLGIREFDKAGKTAGTVYAVSTTGGILMTLLMGFYLLPEWGVKASIWLVAVIIGATSLLFYASLRKYTMVVVALVVSGVILTSVDIYQYYQKSEIPFKIVYQSEGILGQVAVIDFMDKNNSELRSMLINGIPQNLMIKKHMPFSKWTYIHRIATLCSNKPENSKALLIGLAGGNLAMELEGLGFQVDAVEIDKRMPDIAERYFGFTPENINVIIDDGRHYINNTDQVYDIIIIDVLNGEVQPQHLFTKEAMENMKRITNPDALVMFNFQGFLKGENGLAARSVYKTLVETGLSVKYNTYQENDEVDGDILFIASPVEEPSLKNINEDRLNLCCQILAFEYYELITNEEIDLSEAIVLTDDKYVLEKMNLVTMERWRKDRMKSYGIYLAKNSFSLFD